MADYGKIKKYTHIVFDVDGTLVDSIDVTLLSLQETVRQIKGELLPLEDLRFAFGIPAVRDMEILGVEDPEKGRDLWIQNQKIFAETIGSPLFEDMRRVLDTMKDRGVSLGVITSRIREENEEKFAEMGISDYFSCVITASDTKRGKPYADPMLEYLRRTGASRDEVLYFGDTAYDMDCASAASVDSALALWGCVAPDGVKATYRVEKVGDILNFI